MTAIDKKPSILDVNNLKKYFYIKKGFQKPQVLRAVDGVSFRIATGEALGIVGESGCGKTTLGRTVLMLQEPTSGIVSFKGINLTALSERKLRKIRGQFQIIFQDPYSSLNPRLTVGRMLSQILRTHGVKDSNERKSKCLTSMEMVGLTPGHLTLYPHEFSGGQRQRIAIARAIILNPNFIVADEPSSALDMSIQAQILNLMKRLQQELNISYLFITHNLAAARFMCDRIAVMYLGKIVELAARQKLFENPSHPYTKALLSLCPVPNPDGGTGIMPLKGEVPSPIHPPSGCRFHPRCVSALKICRDTEPDFRELETGHSVACHAVV